MFLPLHLKSSKKLLTHCDFKLPWDGAWTWRPCRTARRCTWIFSAPDRRRDWPGASEALSDWGTAWCKLCRAEKEKKHFIIKCLIMFYLFGTFMKLKDVNFITFVQNQINQVLTKAELKKKMIFSIIICWIICFVNVNVVVG